MFVGSERFMVTASATHVQICLLEVLRAVFVVWVALVRHCAAAIHDVMPVPRPVWLANTTKVDVDCTISLSGNPDVIEVLLRYAGFLRQSPFCLRDSSGLQS